VTKVYGCTSEALEEKYWVVGSANTNITCDKIEYNEPRGQGDLHYCDVFVGNKIIRVFEPTEIEFERD
jgi:hypothetical protein